MCGIYGVFDRRADHPPGKSLLSRMGKVMQHRGPDDEGAYCGRGVAIGMRRLSIIDLSGGHQPIANEDETLWVICNGEIYNFEELRSRLISQGHKFRTKSDTETIVHLYEQEGIDFPKSLRGMFAIALWDANSERLILVRDRLGKKPLYVWQNANRLVFASEIKSILEVEGVPREMNLDALPEYLALGYAPAPLTLFRGIEKVLPGHILLCSRESIQDREYWDVRPDVTEDRSEGEWIELVRDKLLESVKLRLISDVPLGAFLSGGIDSSAVVAAMARLTNRPVKTYSIGFEGDDSYYNELPYARVVADAFATDHHEIIVRPDATELLPRLVWHLDEPIADSASITTYLVSRLARESVTVILSGVGGDELFGGYRRYLNDVLWRYYRVLPSIARRRLLPAVLARLPKERTSAWKNNVRYATAFVKAAEWDEVTRYESYVGVFSQDVRAQLVNDRSKGATGSGGPSETLMRYFAKCAATDSLRRIMYVDIKTSLVDDLLLLTDKMTMAASIECRAPFVDAELVELASSIPTNLKVRGLSLKYLLKKAVAPWLPASILNRKKRGFGAPLGSWLRKDLKFLVHETLSPEQVRKRGVLNPSAVQEIISAHESQRQDHTDHLLALIGLELWSRIFLDGLDWHSDQGSSMAAPELR